MRYHVLLSLIVLILLSATVSAVSPTFTSPSEGDFLGNVYRIDWTGDENPWTVEYNDGSWNNICASTSNNYCDWDTTLVADGPYLIRLTDTNSNKVSVNVSIDNIAPTNPNVTTPSVIVGETHTITWQGIVEANFDRYDIYYRDAVGSWQYIGNETNVATTSYVWDVPSILDFTTSRLRVVAVDSAGKTNQSESVNFTIDTVQPVITTVSTDKNIYSPGETINVTWTLATDTHVQPSVDVSYFDGTSWNLLTIGTSNDGQYEFPATAVDTDIAQVRIAASDNATPVNTGTQLSSVFSIDNQAPVITLISPMNNTVVGSTLITFDWAVNDSIDPAPLCNLTIDGVINESNTATYSKTVTLSVANHSWAVKCWDNLSNTATSSTYDFTIDTRVPNTYAVSLNKYDVWNNETIEVTAIVTNVNPLSSVQANLDGNLFALLDQGNGIWGTTIDLAPLGLTANNQTQLYVYGSDIYNNSESQDADNTVTFTIRTSQGDGYINMNAVLTMIQEHFTQTRTVMGDVYATMLWTNANFYNKTASDTRYLTNYTEQDPIFNASAASTIVAGDILNWDIAYGWGNHALGGYALNTSLNTEIADRVNGDLALGARVDDVNTSSINADLALGARVDSVNTSLNTEITDRTSADTVLGVRIDSVNTSIGNVDARVDSLNTSLNTETTDRIAADTTLGLRVDSLNTSKQDVLTGNEAVFTGWDKNISDDFNGSWNLLTDVPADIADGDDNTQLNESQVDAYVANNGYLTVETDPVYIASTASTIVAQNITDWYTAFGWGDHSLIGYLTVESDPVYLAGIVNYYNKTEIDVEINDLNTSINTESGVRSSADILLNGRVDDVNASLNTEIVARTTEDVVLASRLDDVNTSSINADLVLDGRVDSINASLNNTNNEVDAIDTRVTALEIKLANASNGVSNYLETGWQQFKMPSYVLTGTTYTDALNLTDYNVTTVLASINGSYDYLSYNDGTNWRVYVPVNVTTDFTVFPTAVATPDHTFHIHMTTADTLSIGTV